MKIFLSLRLALDYGINHRLVKLLLDDLSKALLTDLIISPAIERSPSDFMLVRRQVSNTISDNQAIEV